MVRLVQEEEEKERLLQSPQTERRGRGDSSPGVWPSSSSGSTPQLSVGAAEKTFFAMASSLASSQTSTRNDNSLEVTEDEEVVKVSAVKEDNEKTVHDERPSSEERSGSAAAPGDADGAGAVGSNEQPVGQSEVDPQHKGAAGKCPPENVKRPPDVDVDVVDSRCDTVTKVPDSLEVVREILEEIESDYHETDEFECDECRGGAVGIGYSRVGQSGSLVVDVHLETSQDLPRRCTKHAVDRFPRSYSESHHTRPGSGRREVLRNLDKIETIGEERLRHLSEGSRRSKPTSLSTEIKQLRRSFLSSRSSMVTGSETDLPGTCNTIHGSMVSSSSNVKFEICEEGASGSEFDFADSGSLSEGLEEPTQVNPPPHPLVASLRSNVHPVMSNSSSTTSMPICRICQLPSIEPSNHLISPCRCLGSIRYVHNPCLLKWLEVSSRKNSGPPCCELCQFQYLRHKKFVVSQCMFPSCSTRDKILHSIFLVAIALMVTCAAVTILCFKQENKHQVYGLGGPWSASELMSLSCGVLFFLAFFLAMYVEVKAKNTIYQLICKFLYMNHEWSIEEYDRKKDPAKQLDSP